MQRSNFSDIPKHKLFDCSPTPNRNESHELVIVGGGPVGLTLALDLGRRGHNIVLLNQFDFVPGGSKAICFSKRTLDIWNRLGVGKRMIEKGVQWNVGKVFRGDCQKPIFQFDLLPIKDQEMPAFINLQQYFVEEILIDALAEYPNVEIRWGHQVTAIDRSANQLSIQTDESAYDIIANWIIACDGSNSPIRTMMGLNFEGRVFEDNFLIADVKFKEDRPTERWFWFDPPWGGASALLHKQPDDVWRLDFQLGWDIDRAAAVSRENVEPLIRGMLGEDIEFVKEWYSVYTFQCRRMARFVHDRIIFAGDAAHLVSPFGARGCNGGIADVDNLGWKLDAVLRGKASEIIETYNIEATIAADENITNSTRSTDFMTPKSDMSHALRNAVLDLAEQYEFARPFVNSGRLSTAISYPNSTLTTPDTDNWEGGVTPGSPALDAPHNGGWLLSTLGNEWTLLSAMKIDDAPLRTVILEENVARSRYAIDGNEVYLVRPDQYIAARWKNFQISSLENTAWAN